MKAARIFATWLATFTLGMGVAQAQSLNTSVEVDPSVALESSEDTLADILTPEELAAEIGAPSKEEVLAARRSSWFSTYTNRLTIIVDKAERKTSPTAQTAQVYLDGTLIYNWYISTGREKQEVSKSGKAYRTSTPTGDFRITWRSKNHHSQTWDAPMPFAQFFIGGIALHATTPSHYAELGRRASGGCVRFHYDNAKILWDLVDQVGTKNVLIRVVNGAVR